MLRYRAREHQARARGGPIRIAHCVQVVHSGGVERRRLLLARGLDQNRFDQIILCTSAESGLRAAFEEAGCHVREIGAFRFPLDPAPLLRASTILREFRPHIVHGAIFEGNTVAAIAGSLAGVPVRIGEETSKPANRKHRADMLLRALSSRLDRVVGVSPPVCEYLAHIARIPARKIHLITNGVAEPPEADAMTVHNLRSSINPNRESFIIGMVGRIQDHVKRFSDAIIAFGKVKSAHNNAFLLIIGDGPDRPHLQKLAQEIGVSDSVHFTGYQEDVWPYFHAMDILVHVPAQEAFGLVLAEAMLTGKPIVASNVGGIPHIVAHESTGLIVEPGDIDAITDSIISLLKSPSKRMRLGQNGRRKAEAEFTGSRYISDVEHLYESLI